MVKKQNLSSQQLLGYGAAVVQDVFQRSRLMHFQSYKPPVQSYLLSLFSSQFFFSFIPISLFLLSSSGSLCLESPEKQCQFSQDQLFYLFKMYFLLYFQLEDNCFTMLCQLNQLCVCAQSRSCVRLFENLWTVACQTPLFLGILQARILEWVALPFSRSLPLVMTCICYLHTDP